MVHPGAVNTQAFVCTPGSSWRCEHASFCVHTWFILAMWTRKRLCPHLVHSGDVNTQAFVSTPGLFWRCEHAIFLCPHLVHYGDVNTHDFVCTPGSSWRCEHASVCVEVVMPHINIFIYSSIHSPSMFLCYRWLWSSCQVAAWFWAVLVERAVAVHPNAFLAVQTPVSWEYR